MSVEATIIERMFENFAGADDEAVVAAIEESARVEAAAGARRLAAIAELVARRVEPDGDERWYWACDSWDSAAAEVACLRSPPCTTRGTSRHVWCRC